MLVAGWLTNQISAQVVADHLLFNSDIVNLLLKTNLGRNRRPNFVVFVVWNTLVVGVLVLVVWSRKSCLGPAKIASFVFLILFKIGGPRVSLRFRLFFSDVNQGNGEAGWIKDFLTWPQG